VGERVWVWSACEQAACDSTLCFLGPVQSEYQPFSYSFFLVLCHPSHPQAPPAAAAAAAAEGEASTSGDAAADAAASSSSSEAKKEEDAVATVQKMMAAKRGEFGEEERKAQKEITLGEFLEKPVR
jgi:predicted lipid-binding transport protein (Tim44 family)